MNAIEIVLALLGLVLLLAVWWSRWTSRSFYRKRAREDGASPYSVKYMASPQGLKVGREAGKDFVNYYGEERLKKFYLYFFLVPLIVMTLLLTIAAFNDGQLFGFKISRF